MLEVIFWASLIFAIWTYLGYPLSLWLASFISSKQVVRREYLPNVTLIVTAYNEEKRITEKIENSLGLDYPRGRLEILIVSDGSTDRTEEIARGYADRGVRLLSIHGRHGKHYCQGRGTRAASADILVLTDATTFLKQDAVRNIVRNFADPRIGCVSGMDEAQSGESGQPGEGMYVRYEMLLRKLEGRVGSLVGVSGSFFAVRKELTDDWLDDMSSDFYLPIIAYIRGYRAALDMEAIGSYQVAQAPQKEFRRKVRTVVHGMAVLARFRQVLNPFNYGSFALQMFSHKLSRWLVPFYLIILLATNFILASRNEFYLVFLMAQLAFYGLAGLAFLIRPLAKLAFFRVPFYFLMVNLSILVAWVRFLNGKDYVLWEPTAR